MTGSDIWTILYSAPEESPKEHTGDVFPVRDSHGRPLLRKALDRARSLTPNGHIVAAVLEQEEPWWSSSTQDLPSDNVVKQPFDRGSAAGILLSLARIFHRDPQARVVVFCSDHVDDDVTPAIQTALSEVAQDPKQVMVLGRRSNCMRCALHPVWLIPESVGVKRSRVAEVKFDPTPDVQKRLTAEQAFAAAPVVVTSVETALRLFERTHPDLAEQVGLRVRDGRDMFDPDVLEQLYPFLNAVDFFRGVLAQAPESLTVLQVCEVEAAARSFADHPSPETSISL